MKTKILEKQIFAQKLIFTQCRFYIFQQYSVVERHKEEFDS